MQLTSGERNSPPITKKDFVMAIRETEFDPTRAWNSIPDVTLDPRPAIERRARLSADGILNHASQHMKDRAVTYDSPEGERSMYKTVAAFNTINNISLTTEQGWQFMALLKIVRSTQGVSPKADTYEDLAAYAALMGEAAFAEEK